MKIVAVVPMKLNSSRLPQKNIKPFTNGEPLCRYILKTLLKVKDLEMVYAYCSNPVIKKYLPDGTKYLQRPEILDLDSTSMTDVLRAFAIDVPADIYLMSHTTAPFVKPESIQRGLEAVKSGNYDSAFSAKKLQDFLWREGKPMNYSLNSIPRTQDLPILYEETSGFYIYRRNIISENNRRIGNKPYIVEVDEIEAIDIDEANDFIIADAIYNFLFLSKALGRTE